MQTAKVTIIILGACVNQISSENNCVSSVEEHFLLCPIAADVQGSAVIDDTNACSAVDSRLAVTSQVATKIHCTTQKLTGEGNVEQIAVSAGFSHYRLWVVGVQGLPLRVRHGL